MAVKGDRGYGAAPNAAPARRVAAAAVLAAVCLVLVACSGGTTAGGGAGAPAPTGGTGSPVAPVELPQARNSPSEEVPSALDDPTADGLPGPLVDVDRLIPGGPPPDGIPAIDRPRFLRGADITFLDPGEPVLALEIGGEARAYPVQLLIWHEIVNDTVGGIPVAVTYCPLCNSALAFDRRAAGRVLDFGVSGLLYNSDLVMYDRQTRSLWPQIDGRAVAGALTGTELTPYAVTTLTWAEWWQAHPDGWVLSRDTGHQRDYGRNPYVGYDTPGGDPFLFDAEADPRLPPKTRVLALHEEGDAVAVVLDQLATDRVLEIDLGGRAVVLLARPGLISALDTPVLADGRQVAATGAYQPVVDGRRLTFTADGGQFVDAQTGSRWNLLGQAIDGPLRGRRLTAVQHVDTFWFAWAAFQPDTRLIQ